ncbi:MAG: sulfur carrier protein ThiS [Bacilli bacterium]|nr:sulfur carrier protein ThiS [Bacilli bacterium]
MKLIVDYISSNEYPDKFTISDLLRYKDVEPVPWLIVSVNETFYKRERFDEIYLNDGDRVDLIYVRGGG